MPSRSRSTASVRSSAFVADQRSRMIAGIGPDRPTPDRGLTPIIVEPPRPSRPVPFTARADPARVRRTQDRDRLFYTKTAPPVTRWRRFTACG